MTFAPKYQNKNITTQATGYCRGGGDICYLIFVYLAVAFDTASYNPLVSLSIQYRITRRDILPALKIGLIIASSQVAEDP